MRIGNAFEGEVVLGSDSPLRRAQSNDDCEDAPSLVKSHERSIPLWDMLLQLVERGLYAKSSMGGLPDPPRSVLWRRAQSALWSTNGILRRVGNAPGTSSGRPITDRPQDAMLSRNALRASGSIQPRLTAAFSSQLLDLACDCWLGGLTVQAVQNRRDAPRFWGLVIHRPSRLV